MLKWLFIAVIVVGAFFLVNAYAASTWHQGVNAGGAHVPWALIIIGGIFGLAVWKIKTK